MVVQTGAYYAQQSLYINEFMADNSATIADSTDGSYDDWIEIYNAGSEAINLSGYYMSDDPDNPLQWGFPDTAISAGGFLLIWADGDTGDEGLHANFKLSKGGEFIGLYKLSESDTVVIDTIAFDAQTTDVSYGRYPDGGSLWQSFAVPTPGSLNAPGGDIEDTDSSAVIFDDTVVHNYDLHFYYDNWADSLEYYYENGEQYIPARLTYGDIVMDSIGVRYKGNSSYQMSRSTPKKPFKFKFTKYNKNQTFYDLKEMNFSNCVADPSFMREKIAYDIVRKYVPASRAAYANISVDGELIGLYVQVEEVDEIFLAKYFANASGNLYKAGDDGAPLQYLGTDQSLYEAQMELKTNEDENDWSGLIEMLDALNNTSSESFAETMSSYLDLDVCARLLAFNMVLSNFDSYTGSARNFYLYDDPSSGQFHMIPWDHNQAFGSYSNDWDVITADIINVPNLSERPLNQKILENDSLRALYFSYIKDMINGPASYDSVYAETEKFKALIDEHVNADENKLYSYSNFIANISNDVTVSMGTVIPGVLSFSQERNANLESQLESYTISNSSAGEIAPTVYSLAQNYPNPFNPSTVISFSLRVGSSVKITVYNILGEEVAALVNGDLAAGNQIVTFNASNFASGIYIYRLEVKEYDGSSFVGVRKMALVK
jgi:hypothetical protein